MRKKIHPKLHKINVKNADGEEFSVLSVKSGNIVINSSRSIHPAWIGFKSEVRNNEKADKIKGWFG